MQGESAGRVALVTGAGSPTGIGFATAAALGREGAAVAICSTTERIHARAGALQAVGYDAAGFEADLTDRRQVRGLADEVLDRFVRRTAGENLCRSVRCSTGSDVSTSW